MKKNITISHFVINGCSFTYGDELVDPANEAWPAVLAKKFGVPLINLACGGTGNERILRTTTNYFFLDSGPNPFYIIGMSSMFRREEYFEVAKSYIPFQAGYISPMPHLESTMNDYERIITWNANAVELCIKKFHIWAALINLFRANNTDYIMLDMIPSYQNEHVHIKENIPKLYEYIIDDPNYIDDYGQKHRELTVLEGGHYDIPSNKAIADVIYQSIIDTYNVTIGPAGNLLRPKDFFSQDEQDNMQGRHAWL